MTLRSLTVAPSAAATALTARFAAIRRQLEVREAFPPGVRVEAERAAANPSRLPDHDITDLPFATLDPAGSRDLDQAFHLSRDGAGWRVRYAIADVPAFVDPGGAVDADSHLRGVTVYCPDTRVPLHPPVISEGAASLLPGEVRPAFVWDLLLDGDGAVRDRSLTRARVRSVAQLAYEDAARTVASGGADERLGLLREVGTVLIARERDRGGASLPSPQQEVRLTDGRVELTYRPADVVEDWNAQLSLLTGMTAADMMLSAGLGILRTMASPDAGAIERVRREAAALGIAWPDDQPYGELIRSLDRANPRHMALVHAATALFRGAGYTVLGGSTDRATLTHAAVAAPYAHVTAPLRRLVDRYGLVVCEAVGRGATPPDWVVVGLPALPEVMARADRLAGSVERACVDAAEAAILASHVGERLGGVVIDALGRDEVLVRMTDLAVEARAHGVAEPGATVEVMVDGADVSTSTTRLRLVTT